MRLKPTIALWRGNKGGTPPIPPGPPAPGPLEWASLEDGLTSYTKQFGLAEPQAVVGMAFHYTGTPTFTVTHGGEPLVVHVALNSTGMVGSLLALGRDLTVETANLVISCTGGAFGGIRGRINEIPYDFMEVWEDSDVGTGTTSQPLSGPEAHIFAVGTSYGNHSNPGVFVNLTRRSWGYAVSGVPIMISSTPGDMNGWTNNSGVWTHVGPETIHNAVYPFEFSTPATATLFCGVDATVTAGNSLKLGYNTTLSVTATTINGDYLARVTNSGLSTSGIMAAVGDATVREVRWYDNNQRYLICTFASQENRTTTTYSEVYGGAQPYAVIAVGIAPYVEPPPSFATNPTITGSAIVGSTLTGTDGTLA